MYFSEDLNKELFKLSIKYPLNNNEPENISTKEKTSINPLSAYVMLLRKTVRETKEEYMSILEDNINLNPKIIIILIEEKAKETLKVISEKENIVEMLEEKDLKIQAIQADTWLDINKKFADKLLNKIELINKNNNVISSEEGLMLIKQTIESL